MSFDGGEPDSTLDDDVPVYEPLYPELEDECSHPKCEKDSGPRERLCENCVPIMNDKAPDRCNFCGQELTSSGSSDQNS